MYSLRLLGGFALLDEAGDAVTRLSQRRAEAVLAVLGVAGDLGCTRDRLLVLLWPDCDGLHARHRLRNELHVLRTAVCPNVIVSVGDDLRLNASVVHCDVQLAQRAARDGNPAEAVRHCGGRFLEGFHVDHADEFERWLDDERSRLQRLCLDSCESLARQAMVSSDWRGAASWWEHAIAYDPHNSRLVLQLMKAFTAAGDRPNALVCAERHRRRMIADLDLEPDAAIVAEVQKIKRELGPLHGAPYLAEEDRRA